MKAEIDNDIVKHNLFHRVSTTGEKCWTDCFTTTDPNGETGKEWCRTDPVEYIDPNTDYNSYTNSKKWGYCDKIVSFDDLRV